MLKKLLFVIFAKVASSQDESNPNCLVVERYPNSLYDTDSLPKNVHAQYLFFISFI
jgi:hypothetical protein